MEYLKNEEKFYELIEKKREEVNSMNTSEEEKKKLYILIDETVQRYGLIEKNETEIKKNVKKIKRCLIQMAIDYKKLSDSMKIIRKEIPNLERIVTEMKTAKLTHPFSNN